jgi:hypothetical protein
MIPIARAFATALLCLTVASCDDPAPRTLKIAPVPRPSAMPVGGLARPAPPSEVFGPFTWDSQKTAFVFQGRALRMEKLWTFDGSSEGFVVSAGESTLGRPAGLVIQETKPGVILRSPAGLNIPGATRSLILVRLSRLAPGGPWDGTVYYSTADHGETQNFFRRPVSGDDPAINQTQTLVYDMHTLTVGGDDWRDSVIDQIRLDLDARPGGAIIIHQAAIAADPRLGSAPAAPPN